jgi:sulfite reductase (NADPH) flavoprotein alpha-component
MTPLSVPMIPDTAPFTPAQRAWLNGFFAGLLGAGAAPPGAAVAPPVPPTAPVAEEEFPWHDPALDLPERLKLAEGKPPERVLMAAMAQLDCGSCGYLCQTYAEAIARGEEKDLTKCSPGGKATAKKIKELVQLRVKTTVSATPDASGRAAHVNGTAPKPPGHDRDNPVTAKVKAAERLTAPASDKDVCFVALDLDGTGLTYEVGDALGVYPENCPELIDAVLRELASDGSELVVTPDGRAVPAREALRKDFAVTKLGDRLVSLLADHARGAEADALRALAEDDPDDFLGTHDVLDLLARFPSARPPVRELVAALTPLAPRLYSISSSPKAHPGEVHLTVGVVRYDHAGRPRKGVASTFLAERAGCGSAVRVFAQAAHGFRLPRSGDTPVIMVGPGTGVAPFRAFLQERRAAGARGKNWLFFGDRRRDTDFLYRGELDEFARQGVLTRLDTAFSRDQAGKVYVQDRLRENAAELWGWLNDGAHFYVCGDARRMARDVDQALHALVAEQGRRSPDQARQFVRELTQAGRYQRDVY